MLGMYLPEQRAESGLVVESCTTTIRGGGIV